MSKSRRKDKSPPPRVRFPEDEARFSWLPTLLDAYEIIDKGVAVSIEDEKKKRRVKLACRKGCGNCCQTHRDIPVYPHEIVGIYWFAVEKTAGPVREVLKRQLSDHSDGHACPFLVDGSCSIHPLRPAACRQFNVFDRPCAGGEDPYYSRREDVLTPIRGYTNKAFSVILPFYGIADGSDESLAVSNIIHTRAVNLQTYSWKKLAGIMDEFDRKGRQEPHKD